MTAIEKVTIFVTDTGERNLLLFRHTFAGIQIPAGTVESGETSLQAAKREAAEETGLEELSLVSSLGSRIERLPPDQRVLAETATVFARPDPDSFDWASIRKGVAVRASRQAHGFTQVTYAEQDDFLNPSYITYQITGWVQDEFLADSRVRHFFHFRYNGERGDPWWLDTDHHRFELFWASLDDLPAIVTPQNQWLEMLRM